MMTWHTFYLSIAVLFVLWALFVTGWTDCSNAIVTVVSTGVMALRWAILMAVVLNFAGSFWGKAVLETVSQNIVDPRILTLPAVIATMFAVICWGSIAGAVGWPVSKSHSLLSGIAGAVVAIVAWANFKWRGWMTLHWDVLETLSIGFQTLIWDGWKLVFLGLAFSSGFTFIFALLFAKIVTFTARMIVKIFRLRPERAKLFFDRAQRISAAAMAFTHAQSDTPKFAGCLVLVLTSAGMRNPGDPIPDWVLPLCALTMGLGTAVGGWKILRTVGLRLVRLNSMQGFCAEATASSVLFVLAQQFGAPTSTTHTINTAIVGVSTAKSVRSVRWNVFGRIWFGWISTFLVCGALSGVAAVIANELLPH